MHDIRNAHAWLGLKPELASIPPTLRAVDQWVCWRAVPRDDGRVDKIPLQPNGNAASSTDSRTWSDFGSCVAAYEEGDLAGIGFVLAAGQGLLGLDFDHVVDADTGEMQPDVQRAIQALGAYAELSPSGTGVRIIGRGELPKGFKNGPTLQAWNWGRFVTVTGHRIGDVEDVQSFPPEALTKVLAYYNPPKEQPQADQPAEGRLDIGQAVSRILAGESLHDSLRDLAASLAASGVPRHAVLGTLEGVLDQSAARQATPERWQARRKQIPMLVDTAREKFGGPEDDWPEIEPLGVGYTEPLPFPLHALPEIARAAVDEYQRYGQQPLPLVASSALATMSLVCQGHTDIARDDHLVGPISLFLLPVARSGERKTAADKAFAAPLRKSIAKLQRELDEQIKEATAKHRAWAAQMRGAERALAGIEEGRIPAHMQVSKPVADQDIRNARVALKARVAELAREEPQVPVRPRLFFSDVTVEGLAQKMQQGLPIGALWEDEGGVTLGSVGLKEDRLLGFLASFSKLWDGTPWSQDRASVEDREMDGKRLTVNLMLQPEVLAILAAASKGVARTQGFLARFLICEPASTMGTRFYREPGEMAALRRFTDRAQALYDQPLPYAQTDSGKLDEHQVDPPALYLSTEAVNIWRAYGNQVETELKETGELVDVSDFASKSAEQAARIAGVFHIFSGYGVDELVSAETMQAAITVASWYLAETLRVVHLRSEPPEIAAAKDLLRWVVEQNSQALTATDIAQRCRPRALRSDKASRDRVLQTLCDHGYLVEAKDGKKRTYRLNPAAKQEAV